MGEPKRYRAVWLSFAGSHLAWAVEVWTSTGSRRIADNMSERTARRVARLLNEDDARKEVDRG